MFAALSPAAAPCVSTSSWTLEDLIIPQYYHDQENDDDFGNSTASRETETSDMLLPSPSSSCARNGESPISGDHMTTSKKISHNANERDRRKRVNNMYSHLRSLLPAVDQTKKLSIPGTVSEVLQYIPQLQMEVEKLINEKEKLLSNISMKEDVDQHIRKKRKSSVTTASPLTISVTSLGGREVLVQISSVKAIDKKLMLSTLEHLEEENGLLLLNASSFESSGSDRAFNSLHLQVQGNNKVESEILRQKLLLFLEKTEAAQLH